MPLTLLSMAVLHAYIILAYYDEDWSGWLAYAIGGLCVMVAAVLVFMRLRPGLQVSAYSACAVVVGVLTFLTAPAVWAAYTASQHGQGRMASAGPQTFEGSSWWGGGGSRPGNVPSGARDTVDPALLDYLQANRGDAKYLVATINSMSASPIILNTDEPDPVITLGGFMGRDPVLSTNQLADLVNEGAVRFFLVPDRERMEEMMAEYASSQQLGQQGGSQDFSGRGHDFLRNAASNWVQDNCVQVPQELWQSSSSSDQGGGPERAQALYDCGTVGR